MFVTILEIQQLVTIKRKFNKNDCPIPFEDSIWSHYRKNILDCKEKHLRQKDLGGSLIKSKEIADNRDCSTIFVMCMWSNLMKGSMCVVICNLMIKIGGRLSEIATVVKSHIKAK
eukprot:4493986-Ditylum_brightwellii.AAC.1